MHSIDPAVATVWVDPDGDDNTLGGLLTAEKPKSLRHRIAAYWAVQTEHSIVLKLAAE